MSFLPRVALFLFGSGFCALAYQIAWLRLLRLIFGGSTPASATVIGIFMAGLGLGGLVLGRRSERASNPLGYYANLEIGISAAAAASPLLISVVAALYVGLGGTATLGSFAGTLIRLVLAAVVLGIPTFLMGGTLPAIVRAATRRQDVGRHTVGLLYAVNTVGAVAGALFTTFFLLELLGIRQTVWLAAALNLLIAVMARSLARVRGSREAIAGDSASPEAHRPERRQALYALVLVAAAGVGFVFFLLELVWYRMMAPILGGSTYTFGIVLAVALAGIGIGSLLYALAAQGRRPSPLEFAVTCGLEAVAVALPLAAGDRIAFLALRLRDLSTAGFGALATGWTAVTCCVVLPAAVIAGYQFPLLIALLGSGRERIAAQVGRAYAWNTFGAIVGSIAGGFWLIPWLSAPTVWRLAVWALCLLAAAFLLHEIGAAPRRALLASTLAVLAIWLTLFEGPTGFWRHGGIGAGRLRTEMKSPNELEDVRRGINRTLAWEVDGRESSVAVSNGSGYAFFVNGKADGSARGDAPTQVMSGLVATALHPDPKTGLVIGLGTGSSAGWMARVPTIERVVAVELEPAILRVAEDCAAVNEAVLDNPKVEVVIADAREYLLSSKDSYDVIFSEPSNPYRAGISSLFTVEFYRAVTERLNEEGIFAQWLQAYEVDATAIETIYATLASVFPEVHTWQVSERDLMLLTSKSALAYDAIRIRERLHQEPYASGVRIGWDVTDLEGLLAWFVARSSLAQAVRQAAHTTTNTDDRNVIEFGFARSVGRFDMFNLNHLREAAWRRQEDRPELRGASVDWQRVLDNRISFHGSLPPRMQAQFSPRQRRQAVALAHWRAGDLSRGLAAWRSLDREPQNLTELRFLASALADVVDADALDYIARLRAHEALEGSAILAHLRFREGRPDQAAAELIGFFSGFRRNPWPDPRLAQAAVVLAVDVAQAHRAAALPLYEALSEPFAVHAANQLRLDAMRRILALLGPDDFLPRCQALVQSLEPHVPWQREWLELRTHCYKLTNSPDAVRAAADLEQFLRRAPAPFGRRLPVRGDPGRSGPD